MKRIYAFFHSAFNKKMTKEPQEQMDNTVIPEAETEEQIEALSPDNEKPAKEKKNKKSKKEKSETDPAYTNRELSWLQFDERCLNEAGNPAVPLCERLTFASIFQTNMDEFFMVRVGSLIDKKKDNPDKRDGKSHMTPAEQLNAIMKRVKELEAKKHQIYDQLMGELEPQGIRLINFRKLSVKEAGLLEAYFDHSIAPFLSSIVVGKNQPFPFLNNKEIYAFVVLKSGTKSRVGIIPCTNNVFKRLIEIPSRPGYYMLSEELILHFVAKIFKRYEVVEKTLIRVTRSADIDTDEAFDDDLNYRDAMQLLIRQRKKLSPVRVEITRDIGKEVKHDVARDMKVPYSHIIKVDTPLDFKFVSRIQDILKNKPELFYEKRSPRNTNQLDMSEKLIPQIEKKDVILSYPFQDIRIFLKFLDEAASDKTVTAIKMTLYRVASQSKVIEALVDAAENGKKVTVLMELRARFDEENNIEMSRKLEEAGCKVLYGVSGFKVHSKLCLIEREVNGEKQYMTQIGTGNYNEKTSKIYTDLSLITADQNIGREAAMCFTALLNSQFVEHTDHLLISPKCLQNKVLDMIDEQIEKAGREEPAYIGAKINSLTDKKIIERLIAASRAGVKIELIVRGICCLKPGIMGLTDNISVISVVGRFLEHSRIYRFGVGDEEKMYIASADFMTRNTVRRVEIAAPLYDPDVRARVRHIFDTVMQDDEKGKQQTQEGLYVDRDLGHPEGKWNSQEILYAEAYQEEQ